MSINREWHLANKMPAKPTLDQRVTWHYEHALHCQCRQPDEKMLAEFAKRKLKMPTKR